MAGRDKQQRKQRQAVLLSAAACAIAVAQPASADVIEVSANGTMMLRSGAGAVRWYGATAADGDRATAIDLPDGIEVPAGAVLATASRAPAIYAAAVARIAARNSISPALLEAVAWHESRWQPNAVSRVGAIGLTQLMPATARALGVDPHDPLANLDGGARFLRTLLDMFDGDIEKALAAYNAGPARVLKAGGIPNIAETRGYVASIIGRLASTPTGE